MNDITRTSKNVSSERLAELIEDRERFVSYLEAGGGDPDLDDALGMARDLVAALKQLQSAHEPPAGPPYEEYSHAELCSLVRRKDSHIARIEDDQRKRAAQPPSARPACQVPGCDGLAMVCLKHVAGSAPPPLPDDDTRRLNWWFMNVLHVAGEDDDDEAGSEIEYEARLCLTPDDFRKLIDAEMGTTLTKGCDCERGPGGRNPHCPIHGDEDPACLVGAPTR